jgi:plastocyanin
MYIVKPGDTIWSISREIAQKLPQCIADVDARRQETRRIATAIARQFGVFHPDSVTLSPGARVFIPTPDESTHAAA